MWCLPPKQDARFVACLEDVLEVSARPYDPKRPVVCLDEAAKQLLAQVRDVLPMKPGQPQRVDNEYERHATCALFLLFEPLAAKRSLVVRQRRTALDYAHVVKWLCQELYPQVEKIILVQDNLNTHGPHSLYPLSSLCSRRSQTPVCAHRVALHAQAWLLAQHGGD